MRSITGKRIILIPARIASGRFPGKALAEVMPGVPLVRAVYDRAKSTNADHVIVVTPDREIANYCRENGLPWRPSREDHPTGTHRCAEVLRHFKEEVNVKVVVNWQVDEPLVPMVWVNRLMEGEPTIATLASRGGDAAGGLMDDSKVVKVAFTPTSRRCHWFSRAPMRGAFFHCGVYAFYPAILEELGQLRPTLYSIRESLEQLGWIESGHSIYGLLMDDLPPSVNTPEDLEHVKEAMR